MSGHVIDFFMVATAAFVAVAVVNIVSLTRRVRRLERAAHAHGNRKQFERHMHG